MSGTRWLEQGWLRLVLLALAGGLAVGYAQMSGAPLALEPPAPTLPSVITPVLAPVEVGRPLVSLAALEATRQRPLFAESRRPPDMAALAATAAANPIDIVLLGTLSMGGAERALLRSGEGAGESWVETGGLVGGWRIVSIAKDKVVVEAAGLRHDLVLYPTKGQK